MSRDNGIDGWHTCPDGHKLYTKTWKPAEKSKARMVLVHGFSDHCLCSLLPTCSSIGDMAFGKSKAADVFQKLLGNHYLDLIQDLNAQGIEVFGFDQRGWGRSVKAPREKGLTGPTSQVLADIDSILKRFIPSEAPSENTGSADGLPLFLFGHSMGGQETLHYAALPSSKSVNAHIRGYVVDAPFIGISPKSKPSSIEVFLGRLLAKIMPHRQMSVKLDLKLVSKDPEVQKKYELDPLCHGTGTLEGLGGMIDREAAFQSGDVILKDEDRLKKSVWVGHGTEDGLCDYNATKTWYDNYCQVEDRTFRTYEGWYHQLHAEPGRDKHIFAADVAKWILERAQRS